MWFMHGVAQYVCFVNMYNECVHFVNVYNEHVITNMCVITWSFPGWYFEVYSQQGTANQIINYNKYMLLQ
jgi:hypothetical protein